MSSAAAGTLNLDMYLSSPRPRRPYATQRCEREASIEQIRPIIAILQEAKLALFEGEDAGAEEVNVYEFDDEIDDESFVCTGDTYSMCEWPSSADVSEDEEDNITSSDVSSSAPSLVSLDEEYAYAAPSSRRIDMRSLQGKVHTFTDRKVDRALHRARPHHRARRSIPPALEAPFPHSDISNLFHVESPAHVDRHTTATPLEAGSAPSITSTPMPPAPSLFNYDQHHWALDTLSHQGITPVVEDEERRVEDVEQEEIRRYFATADEERYLLHGREYSVTQLGYIASQWYHAAVEVHDQGLPLETVMDLSQFCSQEGGESVAVDSSRQAGR